MNHAITVDGLSKFYRLGEQQKGRYRTLRESITEVIGARLKRVSRLGRSGRLNDGGTTEHWALRDVSFEVQPGEAIGIIGRNGAGKSTLLKILSQITEPTEGGVTLEGRLGSLLEVGTGFHPELTGRENIFLNGAILGMPRKEIMRKYDAIVEFSEIGKFIDTPVKRYSSGMYVKLAFSVAAHMEPDILLIDEVLSVGDLAFQRKCLDHAKRLKRRNTTLLFVSHNMFSIKAMCDRAIFLSEGRVVSDGATDGVIEEYERESRLDVAGWATGIVGSDPTQCPVYIREFELLNEDGRPCTLFQHGERMRLRLHYTARELVKNPNFNVSFIRSDNVACCNYNTRMDGFATGTIDGHGVIELITPRIKLVADLYSIGLLIWDHDYQRLHCAQIGKNFHVSHDMLNTEFGVYHEPAEWAWGA
ncbi:Teichoic acids export ATP-binding protein TagH [Aquisphaera giovannonii]|uniref:Teichoic acids export ATP-binding protein TagH n=1 Tax=Aquisphaera giovannonii TaxID=406548 RepID=A0A5B9WC94_9BACT|nr:ABC transporter ATP-binding protein [Aquisphaera giovannonii]QEH37849.1 Teichoic acids export ATP-binding protein TagH [Aquisphaera giovannonii]